MIIEGYFHYIQRLFSLPGSFLSKIEMTSAVAQWFFFMCPLPERWSWPVLCISIWWKALPLWVLIVMCGVNWSDEAR